MRYLFAFAIFLCTSPLAAITFYVDFDGHQHPTAYRGQPVSMGPFQGSAADRAEILLALREDLAPFQTIVTDQPPPSRATTGWVRIVIGGTTDDLDRRAGRATWRCDRAMAPDCEVNIAWVAAVSAASNTAFSNSEIATVAAHEIGHILGWMAYRRPHASLATLISHYIPVGFLGNANHDLLPLRKGQVMGGTPTDRSIWWADPLVYKGYRLGADPADPANWLQAPQDDILSIASVLGLAGPDHGSTPAQGTGLSASAAGYLEGAGKVEMNGASWPGMCPPVPLHYSCPYTDEEGNEIAPGAEPGGQGVVFATNRDFFRFDVVANASNGSVPRIEVLVRTVNGSDPSRRLANLDANVEVWFNEPGNGWVEITPRGSRRDSAFDLDAHWVLGFGRQWRRLGEYAVGVRSAGGYGDLGRYTVRVTGHSGVEVAAVDTGGPQVPGQMRLPEREDAFELLEEIRSWVEPGDLRSRLAELLTVGLSKEGVARFLERGEIAVSERTVELVERALHQSGPARVVASLFDWSALEEDAAEELWLELQQSLRHLEEELAPAPKEGPGLGEFIDLEIEEPAHEIVCSATAEIYEGW